MRVTLPLAGLVAIVALTAAVAAGVAVLVVQLDDDEDRQSSSSDEPTSQPDLLNPGSERAAAELAAQQYMYDFAARNTTSDEHSALTEGYAPRCEAQEETDLGWLVHCELRNPEGNVFDRAFDVVVAPDGTVSANSGSS